MRMEDIKDMYKRFYKMWRQKQNEWKKWEEVP